MSSVFFEGVFISSGLPNCKSVYFKAIVPEDEDLEIAWSRKSRPSPGNNGRSARRAKLTGQSTKTKGATTYADVATRNLEEDFQCEFFGPGTTAKKSKKKYTECDT